MLTVNLGAITVSILPASAQEVKTTLVYELPSARAVYLNVCSPEYALSSGRCAKVNLVNRKIEGTVGVTEIDSRHLSSRSRAHAVFVLDTANGRCYSDGIIEGGGTYRFTECR
jgi:hypothetical protein